MLTCDVLPVRDCERLDGSALRVVVLDLQLLKAAVEGALELLHSGLAIEVVEFVGIVLQVEELPLVDVVAIEMDEFVAVGADAVMSTDIVLCGILIVMIVDRVTPMFDGLLVGFGCGFTFQQGKE